MKIFTILMLGDVVGRPGRKLLTRLLPSFRERHSIDCVIANGENSSGGLGIKQESMKDMLDAGVDLITSGNHVWHRKEVHELLKKEPRLLRPANYPEHLAGKGRALLPYPESGITVGVINLLGRVFMDPIESPFEVVMRETEHLKNEGANLLVIDFHAEATAEKEALGFFLDGRAAIVAGTHTHVQTSDEKLLPGGTAYITDLGRCGGFLSVLGFEPEGSIDGFLSCTSKSFTPAKENLAMEGLLISIDGNTKMPVSVKRIREFEQN